jgi:Holliday junction resolvase
MVIDKITEYPIFVGSPAQRTCFYVSKGERAMKEKTLDEQTATLLDALGYVYFKTHGNDRQRSGLPDFIAYKKGELLCIENKTPKGTGTLKALQYVKLLKFVEQGATCIVSDNIAYTINALHRKGMLTCPDKYLKQAQEGLVKCSTNAKKKQ